MRPGFEASTPPASCVEGVCVTCSDRAVAAQVIALLADGMARVDTGLSVEEVSVELVDAAPGDTLLIHAGVAIGTLPRRAAAAARGAR